MESLCEELLLRIATALSCLKDVRCYSILSRRHSALAKPYLCKLHHSAKRVLRSWRRGIVRRGGPRHWAANATTTEGSIAMFDGFGFGYVLHYLPRALVRTLARDFVHLMSRRHLHQHHREISLTFAVVLGLQLRHLGLVSKLPEVRREFVRWVLVDPSSQDDIKCFYRASKVLWYCPTIHGASP